MKTMIPIKYAITIPTVALDLVGGLGDESEMSIGILKTYDNFNTSS